VELEIPRFLDSSPRAENSSAKPGLACLQGAQRSSLSHLPLTVRWTRYGLWTDEGETVLNQLGQVIYRTPDSIRRARELAFGASVDASVDPIAGTA
jgi:hypothetical protein